MVKSLKDKHSCIGSKTIKAINSTWIVKKIQQVINIDSNISNEVLDIILDNKFGIKQYLI